VAKKTNKTDKPLADNNVPEEIVAQRPPGIGGKFIHNKWTYHVPLDPIPEAEIKETFTTDIVVVGAGTSGLAATLTAVENGAKVIEIERHTTFRYSGGHIAAIDSRLQKQLGIKVNKEEICLELMRASGNHANQKLIRMWADNSGETMDWIMDMTDADGVTTSIYQWPLPAGFDDKKRYYPEYTTTHFHHDKKTGERSHAMSLRNLEKHALKLGAEIRYETRAVQLIRQNNGRVTGVIARNKAGDYIQFNTRKAVVLCTGDYGNNPWMMQQYCPHAADIALENNGYMTRYEHLRVAPEPLNTGDGHQMAMRIGAVMETGIHAPMTHATAGPLGNGAWLRVNLNGERYENEDVPAPGIANALTHQTGKKAWQVFDSKFETELPKMGIGLGVFNAMNPMIKSNLEKNTLQANTIKELAGKMRVPANNLQATIDRYNYLAKTGEDVDFFKRPDRLTTIEKPPFYAGLSSREFLVVLGGLETNLKLQPLDAEKKVIPGLYLAGNLIGSRFAIDYPTMCAGLTHAMAYVFGRIAGRYAAEEKV